MSFFFFVILEKLENNVLPAMQAVMKQAILPATKALNATWARSDCRLGAIVDSAAIWVPMDPGLENPHKAYVAITSDRFCIIKANE